MKTRFDEIIDEWSDAERQAFLAHPAQVQAMLRRLAEVDQSIFTHVLDLTLPKPIARLTAKARFAWPMDFRVTDSLFPVSGNSVREVRYRLLSGKELCWTNGKVYRADVEEKFESEWMKAADPAEALLPFAMDHQLGLNQRPVVVFIKGLPQAFLVQETSAGRSFSIEEDVRWPSWPMACDFLGVCK